ncbi:MAG TPA: metallophosphoesterase [Terriglobia bacterium]|nr:metallophosphoesterase [Terriglobia bacterium]
MFTIERHRRLAPPRRMTGQERRRLDPNRGFLKVLERSIDKIASRFIFPHLLGLWHPYSWLLPRRFSLAEISVSPVGWPAGIPRLRILLLSDIHTGAFLKSSILQEIIESLMALRPDMVAIAGDIVTAQARDLDGFLPSLAPLSSCPLGAWYCHGNHDYFGRDTEQLRERLSTIGITTLRNESVTLTPGGKKLILGGLDDWILGKPDWDRMTSQSGRPDLLLSHNPDSFYHAASRNIPLTLSGHTHGGQIRFSGGAPIIRHSKFCLDEGAYCYDRSTLIVSRGLGSVGLPWRYGADPEAILITIS